MKSVSRLALGASLAIGASGVLFTAPADAQRARANARAAAPAQPQAPALSLSAGERTALVALQTAAAGTDRAAQDAALAAARPVVRGGDARFAYATLAVAIGRQRSDNTLLLEGVDGLISSGRLSQADLVNYLRVQHQLAGEAGQRQVADRALARLVELEPNNPDTQAALAQNRIRNGRVAEGLRSLQAAIQAKQATGQKADEGWHRYGLAQAYGSRDAAVRAMAPAIGRGLVAAYPSAVNWRDALIILREVGAFDPAAQMDIWRLQFAAGALSGERDYFEFATALNAGGFPGEAKAVLDQGVARKMVSPSEGTFRALIQTVGGRIAADRAELTASQRTALAAATGTPALRTGDAMLGYGRHAEAIALYQAALLKGGIDANVVNTRLGIAYALSGQRAQAEAAFRAVTGPRSEIAAYWMTWLAQRPA
jgi:tetratricopeptide (TPR) repeat protein